VVRVGTHGVQFSEQRFGPDGILGNTRMVWNTAATGAQQTTKLQTTD